MKTRIRSMKPETHLDEELWDLEQETGLPLFRAFTGLWNCADREGRFDWRPRMLKTLILPYWDGDFSRVLDVLATRHFVGRYACGSRGFGVVRTFKRHQKINGREAASEIPAPPKELFDSAKLPTRPSPVADACATCHNLADACTCTPVGNRTEQNRTERNESEPASATRGAREDPPKSVQEITASVTAGMNPWTDPGAPEVTGGVIGKRFQEIYKHLRGLPWDAFCNNQVHFINAEKFCIKQARTESRPLDDVIQQLLTGFFADGFMKQADYPPKPLGNSPGKYYKPPEPAPESDRQPKDPRDAMSAARDRTGDENEKNLDEIYSTEAIKPPPSAMRFLGKGKRDE